MRVDAAVCCRLVPLCTSTACHHDPCHPALSSSLSTTRHGTTKVLVANLVDVRVNEMIALIKKNTKIHTTGLALPYYRARQQKSTTTAALKWVQDSKE